MLIFHSSFFFSNIENVLRISSNLGEFDVLILDFDFEVNPLRANATKWSNTLKQFVGNLPTNCLSVFDHFGKLALKGLMIATGGVNGYYLFCFNCGNLDYMCL